MAKKTLDAIVIGGGHNGLVAAAYLAEGGQAGRWCSSAPSGSAGSCAPTEPAPGLHRAGARPHGGSPPRARS